MSDLQSRIANLTPEQIALLAERLQKKRAVKTDLEAIPCQKDRTQAPLS